MSAHYVIPREIVTAVGKGDHAYGAQLFDALRENPQAPIEAPNVRCRSHGGSVIEPSDGDYLIYANDVKRLGKGDYERGCRVLDQLVQRLGGNQHLGDRPSLRRCFAPCRQNF